MRGANQLATEFHKLQERIRKLCLDYTSQDREGVNWLSFLSPKAKAAASAMLSLSVPTQLEKKKEFDAQNDDEIDFLFLNSGVFFKAVNDHVRVLLEECMKSAEARFKGRHSSWTSRFLDSGSDVQDQTEIFALKISDCLLQYSEFISTLTPSSLRAVETIQKVHKADQERGRRLLDQHLLDVEEKDKLNQTVIKLERDKKNLEMNQTLLNETIAQLKDNINRSQSMADRSVYIAQENRQLNASRMPGTFFAGKRPTRAPQTNGKTSDMKKLQSLINPLRVRLVESLLEYKKFSLEQHREFIAEDSDLNENSDTIYFGLAKIIDSLILKMVCHFLDKTPLDEIFKSVKALDPVSRQFKEYLLKIKQENLDEWQRDSLPQAWVKTAAEKSEREASKGVVKTIFQLYSSEKDAKGGERLFELNKDVADEFARRYKEFGKPVESKSTIVNNM